MNKKIPPDALHGRDSFMVKAYAIFYAILVLAYGGWRCKMCDYLGDYRVNVGIYRSIRRNMTVGTVSIPNFISSKFSFGNLYLLGVMVEYGRFLD